MQHQHQHVGDVQRDQLRPVEQGRRLRHANGNAEYYAFGNPQPTFDPTTNALTNLQVQVVGAATSSRTPNGYLFDTENINLASTNGFLNHVWWSNFESYSQTGDYPGCTYNWQATSLRRGQQQHLYDSRNCGPVYFARVTTCSARPTPTTPSTSTVRHTERVTVLRQPADGASSVPSSVTTADPNCLFVGSQTKGGMNGDGRTAVR